jgi:hypothetical protein
VIDYIRGVFVAGEAGVTARIERQPNVHEELLDSPSST